MQGYVSLQSMERENNIGFIKITSNPRDSRQSLLLIPWMQLGEVKQSRGLESVAHWCASDHLVSVTLQIVRFWVIVVRKMWNEVLCMQSESPKQKISGPICMLPWLFVTICKFVIRVLLFVVVSTLFSILWLVESYQKSKRKVLGWNKKFSVLKYRWFSTFSSYLFLLLSVCTHPASQSYGLYEICRYFYWAIWFCSFRNVQWGQNGSASN